MRLNGAARVVRVLHGVLLAGLVVSGAAFFVVLRMSHGPLMRGVPLIGPVLVGCAVAVLGAAVTVLRARIPSRSPAQAPDAYWEDAGTRASALVLWAVIEGAGLLAATGYLLSGGMVPAVVFAAAVATIALHGPGRLEDQA